MVSTRETPRKEGYMHRAKAWGCSRPVVLFLSVPGKHYTASFVSCREKTARGGPQQRLESRWRKSLCSNRRG